MVFSSFCYRETSQYVRVSTKSTHSLTRDGLVRGLHADFPTLSSYSQVTEIPGGKEEGFPPASGPRPGDLQSGSLPHLSGSTLRVSLKRQRPTHTSVITVRPWNFHLDKHSRLLMYSKIWTRDLDQKLSSMLPAYKKQNVLTRSCLNL